jgi:hypothetical protein
MMITTVQFSREGLPLGGPIGSTTATPKAKFDHLCSGCANTLVEVLPQEAK